MEEQCLSVYARIAIQLLTVNPAPELVLPDGRPKLASWRWAAKSTLFEPADYFCFALAKAYKEPGSVRDKWCRPILKTNGGVGFGAIMDRDMVRDAIKDGLEERIALAIAKMD